MNEDEDTSAGAKNIPNLPRWPSIDPSLSRAELLKRISDRDAIIFSVPRNVLVFVTWCTITSAGFSCLSIQRNHALVSFGLGLMALVALVMALRLFMSVHEHINALLNDPFGDDTQLGKRAIVIILSTLISFAAYGLTFTVSSAVIQTSKSCWIMPESMFKPIEEF